MLFWIDDFVVLDKRTGTNLMTSHGAVCHLLPLTSDPVGILVFS